MYKIEKKFSILFQREIHVAENKIQAIYNF